MTKVLITGAAGFIGSSLALKLKLKNIEVVLLDNLSKQIHGDDPLRSSGTYAKIKDFKNVIIADVRDRAAVRNALLGVTSVVHLAAETGTGQSMYAIENYCDVNIRGTAVLLEEILALKTQIKKVIIASSRAVYGEGKYRCTSHGIKYPNSRTAAAMQSAQFEHICDQCQEKLVVVPTDENSMLKPQSIYGVTKLSQEQLVLNAAASAGINAVALRFQNVYGPGQSLSNPYTGILSIFSSRARENKPISIFEDGLESRDFVYIDDVVESIYLSLVDTSSGQFVFNVGSERLTSVNQVVDAIIEFFSSKSVVTVTGEYRVGDIRHNVGDLNAISNQLKFKPTVFFSEGVKHFLKWVQSQTAGTDKYDKSLDELRSRGLLKK